MWDSSKDNHIIFLWSVSTALVSYMDCDLDNEYAVLGRFLLSLWFIKSERESSRATTVDTVPFIPGCKSTHVKWNYSLQVLQNTISPP